MLSSCFNEHLRLVITKFGTIDDIRNIETSELSIMYDNISLALVPPRKWPSHRDMPAALPPTLFYLLALPGIPHELLMRVCQWIYKTGISASSIKSHLDNTYYQVALENCLFALTIYFEQLDSNKPSIYNSQRELFYILVAMARLSNDYIIFSLLMHCYFL